MTWEPPAGWSVTTLKKTHPCMICGRSLATGDEHLLMKKGKRWRFRCVDTHDCEVTKKWGGHPVYRKKLMQLANLMDEVRA